MDPSAGSPLPGESAVPVYDEPQSWNVPPRELGLPPESRARIRAWSLWMIAGVTILAAIAVGLALAG